MIFRRFKCVVCGKRFWFQRSLGRHVILGACRPQYKPVPKDESIWY